MRSLTMAVRMRCAVDGCRAADCARCFKPAGPGELASASNRRVMRSMTWMEFLDSDGAMSSGKLSNCRILYHNAKSGTVPLWYDFAREFDNSSSSMPRRQVQPSAVGALLSKDTTSMNLPNEK